MRKSALRAILAALALALSLSACAPGPGSIDLLDSGVVLDSGDGSGPRPYDGGPIPAAEAGKRIFSLSFSLDGTLSAGTPALVVGPSSFPYRLYLDGVLLHRFGDLSQPSTGRNFSSAAISLPSPAPGIRHEIRIEADVTLERGALMGLWVADGRTASSYVYWRNLLMASLVSGAFLSSLVIAFYFLAMFFLNGGKDARFIWFALFCAAFAAAYVNMVFNFAAADEATLTKASRAGFFFCAVFMSFYVMESTGILRKAVWIKPVAIVMALSGSVYVFAQKGYCRANEAFHLAMQFIVVPNIVFDVVLVAIASFKRGLKRNAFLAVGLAAAIAASLVDMSFESRNVMPYAWILVYGYLALLLAVFFDLAIAQAKVSRIAQDQARDLNLKNDAMREVMAHVSASVSSLKASAEELAVSTREMSATGAQQAAAVREIVSTMEDANSLIQGITENSSVVRGRSDEAAREADDGSSKARTALEKLEAVIGRISDSINMITDFNEQLGSITDIVKLIEGIATQIRIIAFNASLEAVAAGPAGKNFRIVAEEVKRLADSTMESVKGIRGKVSSLVSASNEVVAAARQGYVSLEQGWDIASGIGGTFAGIAMAAESSARATAEIDSSLREESSAFQQILGTLKEISSGVNNFVASAEHTSETSHLLNEVAERLYGIVAEHSPDANAEDGATEG